MASSYGHTTRLHARGDEQILEDYLYISDRKVQNYAAQIPAGVSRYVSAEVRASLGFISTKLNSKSQPLDRVSRMLLVKKFVERNYDVGTTLFPGKWVGDELQVQNVRLPPNPDVFLLIGSNEKNEICALAGSANHVLGKNVTEAVEANASYFPDFAELVTGNLERADWRDADIDMSEPIYKNDRFGGVRDSEVCAILHLLLQEAKGRRFPVRFLARCVFESSDVPNKREFPCVKVFTPLYVSLLDEY